ncbi:unnamed protein product [Cuscuta epithymum]|uniref:Uncharacterized protein n=1 Tax=Cuscuta epithymum TaxID=186058 RepID=A0AAV0DYQ7_9ASTE|nr:unnamed protein product [Cuscuta epithymum]
MATPPGSSSIEPELKKPKLDHGGDQCEVESFEEEPEEWEFEKEILPQDFQDELYVELCNSALAYYLDKHPGESYGFKNMKGGYWWFVWQTATYVLEFCAENLNMDDKRLQSFSARVLCHHRKEPELLEIKKCVLLKDGVEQFEKWDRFGDAMPEIPLEDLKKRGKEYENAVELCRLALQDYQSNHPEECYEFVSLKKVKRYLFRGFQYKLVFLAKHTTLDDNPLATFQALGFHLVRAVEVHECETIG